MASPSRGCSTTAAAAAAWGDVYNRTRSFFPMLQNADQVTWSTSAVSTASGHRSGGPQRSAHRLLRREIRGKGIHGGADHRSPDQRAPHQVLGVIPVTSEPRSRPIRARSRAAVSRTRWTRRRSRRRARIAWMGRDISSLSDEDVRKVDAEGERRFSTGASDQRGTGRDYHTRRGSKLTIGAPSSG